MSQRTLKGRELQKIKWEGERIVGCQSTNHVSCTGDLWECERCNKKTCWEEGSTDLFDLCDDCWYDVRVLKDEYLTLLEHWQEIHPKTIRTNQITN